MNCHPDRSDPHGALLRLREKEALSTDNPTYTKVTPFPWLVIPSEAEESAFSTSTTNLHRGDIAPHSSFVYLMSSRTRVLYCGLTNNLQRRVKEEKAAEVAGFTADSRCERLVYFERFQYVRNALEREKQIKTGPGIKSFRSSTKKIPRGLI